jgi:alkaline phosphatase D
MLAYVCAITTRQQDVDFVIKVDATGLAPATVYYYRFFTGGASSPIGRTKTLPAADAEVETMSLATVSCSYYDYANFTAYARVADKAEILDAVVHLGARVV